VEVYLNIALIITSIALILSVILQSKGAGLGGLTGADTGGVFTARRGIEKTLFRVTVVLSFLFFTLALVTVKYEKVALAASPSIPRLDRYRRVTAWSATNSIAT